MNTEKQKINYNLKIETMLEDVKKKINEDYLETEVSKVDDGDLKMVMDNQEAIDKKLNNSGLKKYSELGKLMFGMIKDYRKGELHTGSLVHYSCHWPYSSLCFQSYGYATRLSSRSRICG